MLKCLLKWYKVKIKFKFLSKIFKFYKNYLNSLQENVNRFVNLINV